MTGMKTSLKIITSIWTSPVPDMPIHIRRHNKTGVNKQLDDIMKFIIETLLFPWASYTDKYCGV
jgi:hypothetical protein